MTTVTTQKDETYYAYAFVGKTGGGNTMILIDQNEIDELTANDSIGGC